MKKLSKLYYVHGPAGILMFTEKDKDTAIRDAIAHNYTVSVEVQSKCPFTGKASIAFKKIYPTK